MFNAKSLMDDIELQIEIKELKRLGLSDEEISGYFELYAESWVINKIIDQSNKPFVLN